MYLEAGDITIKPPSFNPQNTLVSMTFKAAETETESWVPTESSNPLWIKEENLFQKVININIKFPSKRKYFILRTLQNLAKCKCIDT